MVERQIEERVLVVDDEGGLQAAHVRILTIAGFKVDACSSAEQAVELLRGGRRYGAVLTDLVMSGMSGIELLEHVHRLHPDVPVIILTGRPSLQSTIAAIEHHSFRYLLKPITPVVLTETVQAAVTNYRLADLKRRAFSLCESEGWTDADDTLGPSLDSAINRLHLVYQPIVRAPEVVAFGYEALVRSDEPTLARPHELFSAAERLGRVRELSRAIRRLASEQLAHDSEIGSLFVNVHAEDLLDDEFYDASSPLSPFASRVVLEITERRSLDRIGDLRERLQDLRALGYRIAVDDLGAGYAGLSCFNLLEPEIVKLDMSLIRNIDTSDRKRALVEAMVRVCVSDLGIEVVCEGVETIGEQEALMALGAPLLQGYLFGRPAREPRPVQPTVLHSEQRLIVESPVALALARAT
jgi:EAL domain-containing protein (putative c-di-GMP-specific phosphodiesterase class I)/CheY-like chemotaxis protein